MERTSKPKMSRSKFNGLEVNGNKYPDTFCCPGGFITYPPANCHYSHCVQYEQGVPIIDFGCCTMLCKNRCYRYDEWKRNRYAEYQAIIENFRKNTYGD